jgi:hypothetical protein
MSGKGKSGKPKGGVVASLRNLVGGGEADEPSARQNAADAEELILDSGVRADAAGLRVSGIADDDEDDALVLVPVRQEPAPEQASDHPPGGDQADEPLADVDGPANDGADDSDESVGDGRERVPRDGADEAAGDPFEKAAATSFGDEIDEIPDEPAEEETKPDDEENVRIDFGSGAVDDDKFMSPFDKMLASARLAAAAEASGETGDRAETDNPDTDDLIMAASDSPDSTTEEFGAGPDDDRGADDDGLIRAPESALENMTASGLADDAEPDDADDTDDGAGMPGAVAVPGPLELEASIRRVVREELSGEMGRRLSENIQRMIRDEIARALSSRK